jgi:hypothetical protein
MEAACERALAVGAHRYRSVASILEKGLDRQPLVPQQAELALPDHANVLADPAWEKGIHAYYATAQASDPPRA